MKLKEFHWPVVLVSFLVVFIIGFFGQTAYVEFQVLRPAQADILSLGGVDAVAFGPYGRQMVLELHLGPEANLAQVVHEANRIARRALGERVSDIEIRDQRTPELTGVYDQLHLVVEEGIATGRFHTMSEIVNAIAAEHGMVGLVQVDKDAVYLQLQAEEAYLFQIIPRGR